VDDGAALLAAIRAHPAEDTPRLVYADWLQERGGDDRAEFIRIQCQLARRRGDRGCKVCSMKTVRARAYNLSMGEQMCMPCGALGRRESELFVRLPHSEETHPLLGYASYGICDVSGWEHSNPAFQFRRGFPERVTISAADWVRSCGAILAGHPLRVVTLTTWPGETVGWPFDEDGPELCADGTLRYSAWPGIEFRPPSLKAALATSE
jgi:uncharacterized protein (TIGR02996 family)